MARNDTRNDDIMCKKVGRKEWRMGNKKGRIYNI